MKLYNLKINFLGDSITEGHGASDVSACFVSLLAQSSGALCRNYGIGGTRIARKRIPSENPKWDLDFSSRVADMEPDADLIVVFGGTNDYGHGDAPLGAMGDTTPWTFYGGLHTLYTALKDRYPTASIVVVTPLHRMDEQARTPQLEVFVAAILQVAAANGLPVLDLYAQSGIHPNNPGSMEAYLGDGLHPNDRGYALLAREIRQSLENL